MSVNQGLVRCDFGDAEHGFCVAKLAERLELEASTGFCTTHMLRRMRVGEATFKEIRETIRIGLIGAGMKPEEALRLVRRYVDDMPRAENLIVAQLILLAETIGTGEDPVGKKPAAGQATTEAAASRSTATTDVLSAPRSTA